MPWDAAGCAKRIWQFMLTIFLWQPPPFEFGSDKGSSGILFNKRLCAIMELVSEFVKDPPTTSELIIFSCMLGILGKAVSKFLSVIITHFKMTRNEIWGQISISMISRQTNRLTLLQCYSFNLKNTSDSRSVPKWIKKITYERKTRKHLYFEGMQGNSLVCKMAAVNMVTVRWSIRTCTVSVCKFVF